MQAPTADFPLGEQQPVVLQTGMSMYAFSDFIVVNDVQV